MINLVIWVVYTSISLNDGFYIISMNYQTSIKQNNLELSFQSGNDLAIFSEIWLLESGVRWGRVKG